MVSNSNIPNTLLVSVDIIYYVRTALLNMCFGNYFGFGLPERTSSRLDVYLFLGNYLFRIIVVIFKTSFVEQVAEFPDAIPASLPTDYSNISLVYVIDWSYSYCLRIGPRVAVLAHG